MKPAALAIDLRGTKISGALFDHCGNIYQQKLSYLQDRQGDQVGELLQQVIDELLNQASAHSLTVISIGLGVPGIYHSNTGTVWAPNIPGWEKFPLRSRIEQHLEHDIPLVIDNDRACYISGEVWMGAARGCSDAIFIAVGTGIGAGILTDGRILRGHGDIAGAIGWMALSDTYQPQYESCGCFEFHASGRGITNMALKKSGQKISTKDLFIAYHQHDAAAREIIAQAVAYWGKAVANLVSIFNPQKIIFGGGIFGPAVPFLKEIYQEALKWAQPISIQQVTLEAAQLGDQAGLYGAAFLAFSKTHLIDE